MCDVDAIFEVAPEYLRSMLIEHQWSHTISRHGWISDLDEKIHGFASVFLPKLLPVMYGMGETICGKGQAVSSMFMIESGICVATNADDPLSSKSLPNALSFKSGDYFGEEGLLVKPGTAFSIDWTVLATSATHLLELTRKGFLELLEDFPLVDRALRQYTMNNPSLGTNKKKWIHLDKSRVYDEADDEAAGPNDQGGDDDEEMGTSGQLTTAKKAIKTVV